MRFLRLWKRRVQRWSLGTGRRGWMVALAAVVLSLSAISMLRADRGTPDPSPRAEIDRDVPQVPTVVEGSGPGLEIELGVAQLGLVVGGEDHLEVELRLRAAAPDAEATVRAPVALALVLDTSGSMHGEKIEQAKAAVTSLIERMHPGDLVALVTYDHQSRLLRPLSEVTEARRRLPETLDQIYAAGGTEIPRALELGAAQLRVAPSTHVTRVVLVSDGLDGSGQALREVTRGVRAGARAGTTLSALGVGVDYDDHWLTAVADAGHGNYAFLETGGELPEFLRRELEEASHTEVEQLEARLTLPPGLRLTRTVGAEARVVGSELRIPVGALFRGDERRVVVELAGQVSEVGALGALALRLGYRTVHDGGAHELALDPLRLFGLATEGDARSTRNPEVHARASAALLELEQAEAVRAWRDGDWQRARVLTRRNLDQLRDLQREAPGHAQELEDAVRAFEAEAEAAEQALPASSPQGRRFLLRTRANRRARSLR